MDASSVSPHHVKIPTPSPGFFKFNSFSPHNNSVQQVLLSLLLDVLFGFPPNHLQGSYKMLALLKIRDGKGIFTLQQHNFIWVLDYPVLTLHASLPSVTRSVNVSQVTLFQRIHLLILILDFSSPPLYGPGHLQFCSPLHPNFYSFLLLGS